MTEPHQPSPAERARAVRSERARRAAGRLGRSARPTRSARGGIVSAGYALGVGLVCFCTWLTLDGVQLKQNAVDAPIGLRRTVAIDALTPFAYVSSHLGISRIESGMNDALARSTPAGSSGTGLVAELPAGPTGSRGVSPVAVHVHHWSHGNSGKSTPPTPFPSGPVGAQLATTGANGPFTIAQPTRSDPVTILVIGDSLAEDVGYGLTDLLGTTPDVRVIDAATEDTGLSNQGYFNWPAHLAADLIHYHPQVVVAMYGGNDWQSFLVGKDLSAEPGTAAWNKVYRQRVAGIISQVTVTGAHLYWMGLPPIGSAAGFAPQMVPSLNAIYSSVTAKAPGVTYVPLAPLLSVGGKFSEYLRNARGQLVQVRYPDGVHLAPPAGYDIAGEAAVQAIERGDRISI